MSQCLAYIRVSTARQGERGVSLDEQREAIKRYAQRNNLDVLKWFEERETAAKKGRPVFGRLMKQLKNGTARTLLIHKIDRSARNLRDWADLGDLIDQGIDVHFVNESLDLRSRGGRLSADIQAVVAADFIRNLREETRKGFYGRLKQGLYPRRAPVGYLDVGPGKPKALDPVKAPLVRKVFELYATARFNLKTLAEEAYRLGLRNRSGNRISLNGLATILHNPFYMGVIHISTTNETFSGIHPPLISSLLFKRVQLVLAGKFNGRAQVHDFLFRCLLRCATCNYSLVGELQKGHVYYRCHTDSCPVTNVRQEAVEHEFLTKLDLLRQSPEERRHVLDRIANMKKDWVQQRAAQIKGVQLSLSQVTDRLNRLTDAFIDGAIDKQLFEERKTALLEERLHWSEQIAGIDSGESLPEKLANRLELAGRAYLSYKLGIPEEKRNLLRIVTSNRTVSGKNVILKLNSFFDEVANRFQYACGSPYRDVPRTMDTLILRLSDILSKQQAP